MKCSDLKFLESHSIYFSSIIEESKYSATYVVYSQKAQTNLILKKIKNIYFNEQDYDYIEEIKEDQPIQLYSYFKQKNNVYMLNEFIPKEIFRRRRNSCSLSNEQLRKICFDAANAIKNCHEKFIAYSDVRSNLSLIDSIETGNSDFVRTLMLFMAPEQFGKKEYDPLKADIWSLGVSLFQAATGTFPFFARSVVQFQKLINAGIFPINSVMDEDLRDIISNCLEVNPELRPDIEIILQMRYFSALDSSKPQCSTFKLSIPRSERTEYRSAILSVPIIKEISSGSPVRMSRIPFARRLGRCSSEKKL